MKKLMSAALAAMLSLTSASAMSMSGFAEGSDEVYVPRIYMKIADGQDVTLDENGNVILDRSQIGDGLTLKAEVYIEDDSLTCWNIAPKIKCATKQIRMAKAYDPLPKGGPYLVYAYAETDENGELIRDRHSTILTINTNYNVINYTINKERTMTDSSPLTTYNNSASDAYPILTFDMEISPNTPYGEHSVYFLTEPEDEPDQRCTSVAMRVNGSTVLTPETSGFNISVEGRLLGDINNDGKIDASDAADALVSYSKVSTGLDDGLTDIQFEAGDVDFNGKVDASDSASILVYYAYVSTATDNILTLEDYYYGEKS